MLILNNNINFYALPTYSLYSYSLNQTYKPINRNTTNPSFAIIRQVQLGAHKHKTHKPITVI